MEDHAHGMRCLIEHDGRVITSVSAEFLRIPMSTCSGAREPLNEIIGTPVGSQFGAFYRDGRARLNCTHMFDLAWLAVAHAARGDIIREYDAEIPDEPGDGATDARLYRAGESVLGGWDS